MAQIITVENGSALDSIMDMIKKAPEIMASFSGLGPYGTAIGAGVVALLVAGIGIIIWAGKKRENDKAMKESISQGEKDQRDLKGENKTIEDDAQKSEKELDEIAKNLKK